MNVDTGIWGKLSRVVIVLIVLAVLLVIIQWHLPVIRQNERMRKEVLKLDAQIQKEEQTSRQLRASIDALKNDTNAVERLAREKLRYAKPGETVIVFESPATNQVVR
jgi:cell division protein FtsB